MKALAITLVLAASSQTLEPSEADWDWLNIYTDKAFERVMPVEGTPRAIVAYRSHRDIDATLTDPRSGIVQWARETSSAFMKCAAR